MSDIQTMIRDALRNAEMAEVSIAPVILAQRDVNLYLVDGVVSQELGEVGSANYEKIIKMLEEGWYLFHIQTELDVCQGHRTVAYFAKMKMI